MSPAEMSKEMQDTVSNIESSEECQFEGLNLPQDTQAAKDFGTDENRVKKHLKRKRESVHESQEAECRQELGELFEYYKEFSGRNLQISDDKCPSHDSIVATLLEESNLSLPKLAEDIIKKLNGRDGFTLAYVRNIVIRVGQRMKYGIPNELADVLEDESQPTLWCWEARDVKLLPAAFRGSFIIRRLARKKIHERISALFATLSAISRFEEKAISESDLLKVSNKLRKVLNKQGISLLIDKFKQKDSADMAGKEAKRKEKEVIKENLRIEKEFKRFNSEAEKEQKRCEKEEAKWKKQMKKRQEENVKEQRLREKEEAEHKAKLETLKQASFMESFIVKSKKSGNVSGNCDKRATTKDLSSETVSKVEETNSTATSSMDSTFAQHCDLTMEELHKLHVVRWRKLSQRNRSPHWTVRRYPKTLLVKELKLQRTYMEVEPVRKFSALDRGSSSCGMKNNSESSFHKLVGEMEESFANDTTCQSNPIVFSATISLVHKKLLQFDKSNRPAYYGTFRRRSDIIGPRHPFRKDSQLDYDVDSDEEWEEEDPGESLSDFEKDNDESLDEESSKYEDGDENEDGFIVPDGYLSDNEGVQAEASSSDPIEDEIKHTPNWRSEDGNEEFRLLLQQQKFLQELTKNALEKSQKPFVILNLNHGKTGLLMAGDLVGRDKHEQVCMQALCMQPCFGASIIDISTGHEPMCKAQESSRVVKESSMKAVNADTTIISGSDLQEFVTLIQSCPRGINKIVEVVQRKFPAASKSQLRKEIQKVSDFIDNRWQVKKEILVKLGLPFSPGKSEGILTYFSKRCSSSPEELPSTSESSSEQYTKMKAPSDQTGFKASAQ